MKLIGSAAIAGLMLAIQSSAVQLPQQNEHVIDYGRLTLKDVQTEMTGISRNLKRSIQKATLALEAAAPAL
jgi:hypothetical protein